MSEKSFDTQQTSIVEYEMKDSKLQIFFNENISKFSEFKIIDGNQKYIYPKLSLNGGLFTIDFCGENIDYPIILQVTLHDNNGNESKIFINIENDENMKGNTKKLDKNNILQTLILDFNDNLEGKNIFPLSMMTTGIIFKQYFYKNKDGKLDHPKLMNTIPNSILLNGDSIIINNKLLVGQGKYELFITQNNNKFMFVSFEFNINSGITNFQSIGGFSKDFIEIFQNGLLDHYIYQSLISKEGINPSTAEKIYFKKGEFSTDNLFSKFKLGDISANILNGIDEKKFTKQQIKDIKSGKILNEDAEKILLSL